MKPIWKVGRQDLQGHSLNTSIKLRSDVVLRELGLETSQDEAWFNGLERLSSDRKSGLYLSWLAITGRYPNQREINAFKSAVISQGLQKAVDELIRQCSINHEKRHLLSSVRLTTPPVRHFMDITSTHSAPFSTGIQRVVRGISTTSDSKSVMKFIFSPLDGILQPADAFDTSDDRKEGSIQWQSRLIQQMHKQTAFFEQNLFGLQIRRLLFPIGRSIKTRLNASIRKHHFKEQSKDTIENLLILNRTITLPEIPSPKHVEIYGAWMDNEIIKLQCILYDFIPLFHAWTVHPTRRGELNLYFRLILRADKVVAISDLVREQAVLIIQAFNLERPDWSSKQRDFFSLSLPSGLEGTFEGEFSKQSKLIIMVGSIEPRKNHVQFFDAIEILYSRKFDVQAVIIGSASWENDDFIMRLSDMRRRGLDIQRLANTDDQELRKWIGSAQVVVQISEAEGFGLPVIESLGLGTRVIVSDIRPLNEWPSPWVSKVPLGDPEALADEIENILNSPPIDTPPPVTKVSWTDWCELLFADSTIHHQ